MSTRRASGSLFRRNRNGKPEERWSISYRVAGQRVTERAYTDKRASEQLLAQRLREAARGEVAEAAPPRRRRLPTPPDLRPDPIDTAIAALRVQHAGLQQIAAAALAYLATAGGKIGADDVAFVATVTEATTDAATRQALAAVLKVHKAAAPRPRDSMVVEPSTGRTETRS